MESRRRGIGRSRPLALRNEKAEGICREQAIFSLHEQGNNKPESANAMMAGGVSECEVDKESKLSQR